MKYLLVFVALVTLTAGDLLKAPQTVTGKYTIASAPPKVDLILFSGLPITDSRTLWSSWGNGCFASNGKYYTAIGDHGGYDGNSFVFEFDPATGSLQKIVDIAQAIAQKKGDYGHGKIHAPIVEYKGALYFATYRGSAKLIEEAFTKGYQGSLLFQYDLKSKKVENLGAIAPHENFPASILDPNRGLLYFYTVEKGDLLVYDLNKKSVKFKGGSPSISEFRAFLMDKNGIVYFTNKQGRVSGYNPDKNSISETSMILPGSKNTLRAGARVTSAGRLFGMTNEGRMFELIPSTQSVKDLGPNFLNGDYTAVMTLSPDEKYIYFVPGSHGSNIKYGVPVVQFRISDGTRKVIAFLGEDIKNKLSYVIAGNYNLQIDPKGTTLFSTFNGAKTSNEKKQEKFGLPCVVTIHIPDNERK